jgi:hypothetical protein
MRPKGDDVMEFEAIAFIADKITQEDVFQALELFKRYTRQVARQAKKIERLEAEKADLLEALENLVEMDRRDNTGDPDMTATDRWRHEAWRNAYTAIAKARPADEAT